jgi:hypothetical protein
VDRGVLDVPVVGVAKTGLDLGQFRDSAAASLRLNGMDPDAPAAAKMLGLLRYVDGDLGDDATYSAMADASGGGRGGALFYLEVPPPLFGRIAQRVAGAGRAPGARVMVEKPFGTDLGSAQRLNKTMIEVFLEDAIYRLPRSSRPASCCTDRSRSPSSTEPHTTCSSRCATSAQPGCCQGDRSRSPGAVCSGARTTSTAC